MCACVGDICLLYMHTCVFVCIVAYVCVNVCAFACMCQGVRSRTLCKPVHSWVHRQRMWTHQTLPHYTSLSRIYHRRRRCVCVCVYRRVCCCNCLVCVCVCMCACVCVCTRAFLQSVLSEGVSMGGASGRGYVPVPTDSVEPSAPPYTGTPAPYTSTGYASGGL